MQALHGLAFRHVDVFSDQPLSGNGLSVFWDASALTPDLMQRITQEMRQFESIFLTQTEDASTYRARIFTMEEELDFAGHPILGAAGVLLLLGGMSYLSVQAVRLGQEAYHLAEAKSLELEPKGQLAEYKEAHQAEPMNFETALKIGELIRQDAWRGEENYRELAEEALGWFQKAIELNPWDAHGYLKAGMCLHWLGRPEEAEELFNHALKIDPKGTFVLTLYGWHRLQLGDWEGARDYFAEGYSYFREGNAVAKRYLDYVERKLAEQQGNL